MRRILFVCTGNTCRSPMAEAMLRKMAADAGVPVEVRSAGVAAVPGSPMSEHSAQVLKDRGIEGPFRSSSVTAEAVGWADLILTMTAGHKAMLIRTYPEAADKTHTLKEYTDDDPETIVRLAERERLAADLAVKRALGEPVPEEDFRRLEELERGAPDYDLADPFGGSLERYRACADELERHLRKLLDRLRKTNGAEA